MKTKDELVQRIYRYFDEVNKQPVVYHWKYKLEEINSSEEVVLDTLLIKVQLINNGYTSLSPCTSNCYYASTEWFCIRFSISSFPASNKLHPFSMSQEQLLHSQMSASLPVLRLTDL